MAALFQTFFAWLQAGNTPHDHDEAYLAESVDLYDLERRMRELDRRARTPSHSVMAGSFAR